MKWLLLLSLVSVSGFAKVKIIKTADGFQCVPSSCGESFATTQNSNASNLGAGLSPEGSSVYYSEMMINHTKYDIEGEIHQFGILEVQFDYCPNDDFLVSIGRNHVNVFVDFVVNPEEGKSECFKLVNVGFTP